MFQTRNFKSQHFYFFVVVDPLETKINVKTEPSLFKKNRTMHMFSVNFLSFSLKKHKKHQLKASEKSYELY